MNMELSKLIPPDIANKNQVVPLQKSGFLLTIAMVDPMDINALDTIEVMTNSEVEAVICTEQEFNQINQQPLRDLYRHRRCTGGNAGDGGG